VNSPVARLLLLALSASLLVASATASGAGTALTGTAVIAANPPVRERVTQYGITWTFEKPASVGKFVNGDSMWSGRGRLLISNPSRSGVVMSAS
jgi:hypothetical protein